MTNRKSFVGAVAGVVVAVVAPTAHATGVIAGATLPEQIVQEATLVQQYETQAQQLTQQIKLVYDAMLNLENLPSQMWASAAGDLQSLVDLVGKAEGLSFAAQNTVAQVQQIFGAPNAPLANYSASLQTWTGNLDGQIAATLQQYKLNADSFQTTQGALAAIQASSQSAVGRMQVLQAGNQIAGLMVNQLQRLEADIQAGNQVEMNALAARANKDNADNNALNRILHNSTPAAY